MEAIPHQLAADGSTIPNNDWPLLVYPGAIDVQTAIGETTVDAPVAFERLFHGNGWGRSWRNGIFSYRHYHSNSHEVLGIARGSARGSARVEFGGGRGVELEVAAGAAVLIPAGVSHYNLGASSDLLVIGAYPPGPDYDLVRDDPAAYRDARREAAEVPRPDVDPVTGSHGGLHSWWS